LTSMLLIPIEYYTFKHVTKYISGSRWTTGLADHPEFLFSFTQVFIGTLTFLKVFGFKVV
jgi:hypothetical protein